MWSPKIGNPLSYTTGYNNFKNLLKFVGIDPTSLALHSPRIGAATDAFNNGVPNRLIDRQGRWRNANSKYRYGRDSMPEMANALKVDYD